MAKVVAMGLGFTHPFPILNTFIHYHRVHPPSSHPTPHPLPIISPAPLPLPRPALAPHPILPHALNPFLPPLPTFATTGQHEVRIGWVNEGASPPHLSVISPPHHHHLHPGYTRLHTDLAVPIPHQPHQPHHLQPPSPHGSHHQSVAGMYPQLSEVYVGVWVWFRID